MHTSVETWDSSRRTPKTVMARHNTKVKHIFRPTGMVHEGLSSDTRSVVSRSDKIRNYRIIPNRRRSKVSMNLQVDTRRSLGSVGLCERLGTILTE